MLAIKPHQTNGIDRILRIYFRPELVIIHVIYLDPVVSVVIWRIISVHRPLLCLNKSRRFEFASYVGINELINKALFPRFNRFQLEMLLLIFQPLVFNVFDVAKGRKKQCFSDSIVRAPLEGLRLRHIETRNETDAWLVQETRYIDINLVYLRGRVTSLEQLWPLPSEVFYCFSAIDYYNL